MLQYKIFCFEVNENDLQILQKLVQNLPALEVICAKNDKIKKAIVMIII